ncbi:MAG: Fic family protein [Marinifilaceae bacterium]
MNREEKLLSAIERFSALGIDRELDYEKFYLYSLITHSTAIEGSTITEVENQLLFDEGISVKGRPIMEQLMNLDLKKAYEQSICFARAHTPITVDMLKELSALVLRNTGGVYNTALGEFSSTNGDLRLFNVTAGAGGRSYMNYAKVPGKLAELCDKINQARQLLTSQQIMACYKVSFEAHYHLVTIHPWADGNGRMCRLLMNQLQFEFGVIPSLIDKDNKAAYIEALIATREHDNIELFLDFMFEEHTRNLEEMIRRHEFSIGDGVSITL